MQTTIKTQKDALTQMLYSKGIKELDKSLVITILSLCEKLSIDLIKGRTDIFNGCESSTDDYALLRTFIYTLATKPELLFKMYSMLVQGVTHPKPYLAMMNDYEQISLMMRYRLTKYIEDKQP
ncbi:hypothetical protein DS891_07120 [Pseudoalteromonas sp. JC28]|uniref:hypothetical protein n=1 Tax=Pseudoalteromonas sp. JC28 TaxID=2267617 RepID=UPI001571D5C4|nr:hypothetical protein [Pseudoalteromonas sp. JC28]NSY33369.1 hypothetical protein [Pseudoalteromonas sp. JC28]